ncbi:MAG: GNAT family N-acetyltransferase [Oscillospiraceae bacterium]|jgi:GNAT superfamily N-acetyltransferase|nr:GNAT family N-acetyltransferase [Oscillospiraceae bacterium]
MNDSGDILAHDRWITDERLSGVIGCGACLVCREDGAFAGWMRWNWLWENTPFLNEMYLLEPYRGKGYGRLMMSEWERLMIVQGYRLAMVSTQQNEYAQHFYEHIGYRAVGGFVQQNGDYEIIMTKSLAVD